jgi:cyclic beta-1,2-glucan synthetase
MYRAGIEGILGIRCNGKHLFIDPCIPAGWPGFEATVKHGSSRYHIKVANPAGRCRGLDQAEIDGEYVSLHDGCVCVPLDGRAHVLSLRLGDELPIPVAATANA